MQQTFKLKLCKINRSLVIKLPFKEFDYTFYKDFKDMADVIINKHRCQTIILDLSEVFFVDSYGVSAIIYLWHLCEINNKKLLISNINSQIKFHLMKTGLNSIMENYDNLKEALETALYYEHIEQKLRYDSKRLENCFGIPFDKYAGWGKEAIKLLINKIKEITNVA